MSDQKPLLPAIAPASGGALTTATGPQRIATRMAENLLGVARSQERALAAQRRYRIGDYEFREADHAQIQRWARRLGMEPEKVVEGLTSSRKEYWSGGPIAKFCVEDGAIVSLVWDFALLPLTDWVWERGLQIARLDILNAPKGALPPLPKCLHELMCEDNPLTSLTLEHVPKLKKLHCSGNQLTEIDLIPVPELQELDCGGNRLSTLDLTPVPGLQSLYCTSNELTKLELTPVPGLQALRCGFNPLTALDLTPVPRLQWLNCSFNSLSALDLTSVPGLHWLNCGYNQLTMLDLTPVLGLQHLSCDSSVNITGAPHNLKVNGQ